MVRPAMVILAFAAFSVGCATAASTPATSPEFRSARVASASPALPPDPTSTAAASPELGWRLVAIGDSIPMTGDRTSFPRLFGAEITAATGRAVEIVSLSANTTDDLIGGLLPAHPIRAALAEADIVTITVGANEGNFEAKLPKGACAPSGKASDCLAAFSPSLALNYGRLLASIDEIRGSRPIAIRLTSPDYNPFIGWSGAPTPTFGIDVYRQVASAYTNLVCDLAPRHAALCVDFLTAFNGPDGTADAAAYLEPDHLHPSLAGRQKIADLLMAAGLDPLR